MKPTVGRIVNFVLGNGEIRPAIIVRVWSDTCVQLRVFLDGTNDTLSDALKARNDDGSLAAWDVCDKDGWSTSVIQDEIGKQPRSWHWPVRE